MNETMNNGLSPSIAQALEEMKAEAGENISLEKVNLAELERRTGISRSRLRRLKENNFVERPHALKGRKSAVTVLSGYTSVLDDLLGKGVSNSSVCLTRLRDCGYTGSLSSVKDYIAKHKDLIPARRQLYSFHISPFYWVVWSLSSIAGLERFR